MLHLLIPKALAYTSAQISDKYLSVATSSQETLIDALVRFLPYAIPIVIIGAIAWFVMRKMGFRR